MPIGEEPEKLGLRERKKRKTRLTLQQQALRLFREQGYHATTIEQIAEASEISPSTFFRYFANKEALVLEDDYDPLLIRMFQEQPANLSPIQALRKAISSSHALITEVEREGINERTKLTLTVPELRAASLMHMNEMLTMIAGLVADRLGRPRGDFEVLHFAGSVLGATMAVQVYCMDHPKADFFQKVDEALARLEGGLSSLASPSSPNDLNG
ncbi:TetR family transcriptional regulator [Cohnella yongneupensis]|uniref:TetR family transcriptional regulator n=1 Tax=Cohnella yongneupensis TaxID=425006 RepID=A0ABW0R779_9BACL